MIKLWKNFFVREPIKSFDIVRMQRQREPYRSIKTSFKVHESFADKSYKVIFDTLTHERHMVTSVTSKVCPTKNGASQVKLAIFQCQILFAKRGDMENWQNPQEEFEGLLYTRTEEVDIKKQDKVNTVDSAFIFLIIQSQNQWSSWSGRRRWSGLVWSLLER